MNKVRKIRKSSGQLADYEPQKFHNKTSYAVQGLKGVSQSEIEIGAAHSILEGTTSSQIQDALINSAKNLVTPEDPDYQVAAARLLNQKIRKEAHGSWEPLTLLQITEKNKDIYDLATLYSAYTQEELEWFGEQIDYSLDDDFVYGGLNQMQKSYLTKRDGKLQESVQEVFMLISLFGFNKYKDPQRKQLVLDTYKALSTFEISLPSPTMGQLRTKFNRYFSCNIIDSGDDKKTIANAAKSIYEVVASGAGLGLSFVDLRELGADIDNGRLTHTGTLPIVKAFTKDTKAFTQPQRGGSSTSYKNFYSMEIEDWMVWGNNKGTEETRERDTDYCVVFNELFFERYKNNEDISLFYANDVPRLSSFMGDDKEFTKLYEHYEKTIPKKKQKKVSAEKLLNLFLNERFLQARLYAAFAENLSGRSSFIVPIKTSNLCLEISVPIMPIYDNVSIKREIYFSNKEDKKSYYTLRTELLFNSTNEKELRRITKEMRQYYQFSCEAVEPVTWAEGFIETYDYFDLDGFVNPSEIGVCILAGVNMGMVSDERLPIVMDLLVRLLEELIDMNEYDLVETEKAAKMRRTCGIGFSDVFHDLARNKEFYNTQSGRQFMSDRVELATYSAIKTSIELAKERGPCVLISDTKYGQGIVPLDYSADAVDDLLSTRSKQDWDSVRADLLEFGMRHSTLFANAPYGSSSVVSNSQPGLEPPRQLAGIKSGVPKLVPEIKKFGKYYTTAWGEDFNNIDYFKFIAIFQKWMDQSISTNQYTNLMKYSDKKVPLKVLVKEMLTLRKYGGKTAYYQNTRSTDQADGLEEEIDDGGCAGGGCKI